MFLYYLIAALSILLYLHGFFPIPARPSPNSSYSNNITNAKYRKAVVVIIDALRLDFISETRTPFLSKTFKTKGCFIHLKVETPTVTLPRVKAITTGNVPQFIDIILNLASPTKVEDSFIHQAHSREKRLVFYGDDIWLKLFPEQFTRSEGTSSFFVNDFTEVDDNVTRNVRLENQYNDWDVMILHYLGLDHIGHVFGPNSPLIPTKLNEMDSIVEEIFMNHNSDTLILVTGDHGMRNSGGHGGSTHPETNVPLIVLNAPCTNDTFSQIDIAANLAILLDFNIPSTSIGQLHQNLLSQLPLTDFMNALKYNTLLLRDKIDLCEESFKTATHLHDLFLLNHDQGLAQSAIGIYQNCSKKISDTLTKTSVQQELNSLLVATLTAITVLLKIFKKIAGSKRELPFYTEQGVLLMTVLLQFFNLHLYVSFAAMIISLTLCYRNLFSFHIKDFKGIKMNFLTFLSVVHPLIFFSSSFLEEEHQFCYFAANTFILINVLTKRSKKWLFLSISVRFVRTINQVGDLWAGSPDLSDWLLQQDHLVFLHLIFITGLSLSFYCSFQHQSKAVDGVVLTLIYCYRMWVNENIHLGQLLWFLILLKLSLCFINRNDLFSVWILVIALLMKPYNVILIPVCVLASRLFQNSYQGRELILAHWWLGNLLFFAQGHDNSLASVDISSGYVGLSEYSPMLVVPQVLCHTYAFPVLSHLLLFTNRNVNVHDCFSMFILLRLYVIIVVFIVTFLHRHHLFVWSVFAPKIFVEASHFGFLFVEACCYHFTIILNKLWFN